MKPLVILFAIPSAPLIAISTEDLTYSQFIPIAQGEHNSLIIFMVFFLAK